MEQIPQKQPAPANNHYLAQAPTQGQYPNLITPPKAVGSKAYKPPMGQFLFTKYRKTIDLMKDNDELYDRQTEQFAFGDPNFNIRDVYQHYYQNTSRYPIQAFLDIYFFDTLQENEKTNARTFAEKQRLLNKTKKFSQLAQKLYTLHQFEDQLILRIKILDYQLKMKNSQTRLHRRQSVQN